MKRTLHIQITYLNAVNSTKSYRLNQENLSKNIKFMIHLIKDFFKPVQVTDRIWNRFVDKGQVPDSIIRLLAFKTIKREKLTDREFAIFCEKTDAINNMIIQLTSSNI